MPQVSSRGFLVPYNYVSEPLDDTSINLSSIFFGFTLSVSVFSMAKAYVQTKKMYGRYQAVKPYMVMMYVADNTNSHGSPASTTVFLIFLLQMG